jgi:hypothetical protein
MHIKYDFNGPLIVGVNHDSNQLFVAREIINDYSRIHDKEINRGIGVKIGLEVGTNKLPLEFLKENGVKPLTLNAIRDSFSLNSYFLELERHAQSRGLQVIHLDSGARSGLLYRLALLHFAKTIEAGLTQKQLQTPPEMWRDVVSLPLQKRASIKFNLVLGSSAVATQDKGDGLMRSRWIEHKPGLSILGFAHGYPLAKVTGANFFPLAGEPMKSTLARLEKATTWGKTVNAGRKIRRTVRKIGRNFRKLKLG